MYIGLWGIKENLSLLIQNQTGIKYFEIQIMG